MPPTLTDGTIAHLCVDGRRVGVVRVAASLRSRTRGLLGTQTVTGALLLSPASSVHTLGMRYAIDVAYLNRDLRVLQVRTMRPGGVGLPRLRARHVIEAQAGTWESWALFPGSALSLVLAP